MQVIWESAANYNLDTIETITASSDPDSGKSTTNVAGIAGGVVVGVVAVAALLGGGFFWMRRKRNAEIEEEHRRNAAVNAFISGGKPPSSSGGLSMSDSRLDPVMNRRMSDGSIADNQDYSRRILRVCNSHPDILLFICWTNALLGYKRLKTLSHRKYHDERLPLCNTFYSHRH